MIYFLNFLSYGVMPDLYAMDADVAQEFIKLSNVADEMGIKWRK